MLRITQWMELKSPSPDLGNPNKTVDYDSQ